MNRYTQPLSNDEIQRYAPSAFATEPWSGQSARYAFLPTVDVIEGMRSAGFLPVKACQSRTRIEGKSAFTKHQIRFAQETSIANLGDTRIEAVLTNSHDGTSAYDLSMGVFRLACLNGLMVSEALIGALHIRHSGNIVEKVVNGSHEILAQGEKVNSVIASWRALQLNPAEQLVLAEGAHELRFETETPITPAQLLTVRRHDDNANDLWTTFNRIQENTIGGGLRARPGYVNGVRARRVSSRAVTGIDQSAKLNKALWTLAEKMASLKAA